MVDIKAEELEDFVTKRLAYEIYRRPDLVDVYNSVNPIDEIKKLGYHLRGIKTAISNTTDDQRGMTDRPCSVKGQGRLFYWVM